MKRIIFTLAFLLGAIGSSTLFAQTEEPQDQETVVEYIYDDAGNRSTRSIQTRSMNPPTDDREDGKPEEDEIADERLMDTTVNSNIKVYPNPTFGIINIELSADVDERVRVYVFDLTGKQLMREHTTTNAFYQVDISHLSNGEYILEVRTGDKKSSWNILKQ